MRCPQVGNFSAFNINILKWYSGWKFLITGNLFFINEYKLIELPSIGDNSHHKLILKKDEKFPTRGHLMRDLIKEEKFPTNPS